MLLLLEIGLGILTFILKDKGWIKNQATYGLRNFILHYREDVSFMAFKMVHHSSSFSVHSKKKSSFFLILSRISKISSTTYNSSGNAVELITLRIGMPIDILIARQVS
jgi:hypothetical protein